MENFTSKQRSNLRSIAQNISPITQIGKGGVSEGLIETVDKALSARELVKLSVLDNATEDVHDLANQIAEATSSTVVCVIGRKIVLYRYSTKKGVEHIEF